MGMSIDDIIQGLKEIIIICNSVFAYDRIKYIDGAIDRLSKYQQLQADYEARLKADKLTMLEELKKEIIELPFPQREPEYMQGYSYCQMNILDYVIQQEINALKGGSR
jgi:hypothetical protein